jgi:trimeric autotransporter adhesin
MIMKTHVLILLFLLCNHLSPGQVNGVKSIPGDYPSIEAAITDLNLQGVGPGGVTINVASGHNETFTSPEAGLISASGSASGPIVFQKTGTGANPVITAPGPGLGTMDYIVCFSGADYITFDGINIQENPENVTPVSQAEWGFALLKTSGINGSQHIIIKNCSITLNSSNSSSCAIYSNNHTTGSTEALAVTEYSGSNSFNSFSGLIISNAYHAFYIKGTEDESPYAYYDQLNEIGVSGSNFIDGIGNTSGTVSSYGIYCAFQNGIKIAGNVFTGTASNISGSLYVIALMTGNNSNIDVYNNVISMTYLGTGAFYGIYISGMGASGTSNTANIHHNNIINNSIPNFTGSPLGYIYISTGCVTANLFNNTIEGNIAGSVSATANGTIYYAYLSSNPVVAGTINIYQNNISRNKRIQAVTNGGPTYLLYANGNGNVLNEMDNSIDSITISSTGITYGLYTLYSGSVKYVHHNSVTNIINANGTFYGIYNGNGSGAGFFHNNKVQNITMNSVSGKLYGIYQSSGSNQFHYNNYITELYAPQASGNPAIYGMYLSGAIKTGAYNNTVYLDASSSGASFGSAGIYVNAATEVELKNNIIVNNSQPGPLGRSVAYQRSSGSLSSYSLSSNSNDFWAGPPGQAGYIYYDGTNYDLSLQDYRSRVSPRDASSVSEKPPFINVSASPYNLHIQASIPSQCEGAGGIVLSPVSIANDPDGNPRYPNEGYPYNPESGTQVNAPDIGADEFGGIVLDVTAPNITFIPLSNTSGTGDRVLTTTITDATGIPTVGTGLPVLYWKINNGSYTPVSSTWEGGNIYSFSFGAGTLPGDMISYYIVAQDLVSPMPNVGSFPFGGADGFAANPPVCITAPSAPYTYQLVGSLSGIVTVGNGKDYSTLTDAIADLGIKEVTEPVTFELWDSNYGASESFPLIINEYAGMGPGKTVTIRPREGLTVKVSGSSYTGILAINGADNIILDGSGADGNGRNLVFENTSTQVNSYVIGLFHNGNRGAQNNTITNCLIKAGSQFSNTWDIVLNANGGDFDNTVITDNELLNAATGIQFVGFPTAVTSNGIISGNIFGSDDNSITLGNVGLHVSNTDGLIISGNTIRNLFSGANPKGINIGINTVNTTITGNTITGIAFSGTTGGGGKGIDVNTGSLYSNITISNNSVSQISGDGWNTFGSNSIVGIRLLGNTGGVSIFFNSVSLSGTISRSGALADVSAAFYAAAGVTGLDVRNNIFTNSLNNSTGLARAFSIYSDAPASAYTKINFNNYYSGGQEAILGYMGGVALNLAAWQAASLQDEFSFDMDPLFVSPTDLHPTSNGLDNKGFYMSVLPADLSGVQRTDPPDMGAFEFGINPDIITLSASRISCEDGTLNGTADANGLTVQTFFDFGPDISYGNSVAANPAIITGTDPEPISAVISIPPLTTFHYRARGVTSAGVTIFSNDQTLTTMAAGTPVTYTFAASNIAESAATLNGAINAHCNPADVFFEYGLTIDYSNTVSASQGPLTGDTTWLVSADISGLEANTLYHFRAVGQNQAGTSYGDDQVFTTICPVLEPTITGPGTACISFVYSYSTETDMTDYFWTVSPGGQILSGAGTKTVSILWNSAGDQSLSVVYASPDGCQANAPAIKEVSVGTLPDPSITGSNIVCPASGLSVYTTQDGFTGYAWSVSEGGTIVSGQGTYQVEVSWSGPGENNVTVNYTNSSGCYAPSPAIFSVDVLPFPGNAGPVTGTPVLCAGTLNVSYSVGIIPGVSAYVWSLPPGVAIVDGENTNVIIVDFSIEAKSGVITVYGQNVCGAGQPSPSYSVTIYTLPPTPQVSVGEFFMLHSSATEGNQWYFNGLAIAGATGQDYQADAEGTYYTIVTLNDCPSGQSNPVEVLFTGLEEPGGSAMSIFPVPNKGTFNVSITTRQEETFSFLVYNSLGLKVYEKRDIVVKGKAQLSVGLSNPSPGIYTTILQGKGQSVIRKVLVAR